MTTGTNTQSANAAPPAELYAAATPDPAQVIASINAGLRRGPRTTEFWLTLSTWILPILTIILHQNLGSLAVPLATFVTGIANAAYAISRSLTKTGSLSAVIGAGGLNAANPPIDMATVNTWVMSTAAALQAMTAALDSSSGGAHQATSAEADPENK